MNSKIHTAGPAEGFLSARDSKCKPVTVNCNDSIRVGFDRICLGQALNARPAPGVSDVVLNPDAHAG